MIFKLTTVVMCLYTVNAIWKCDDPPSKSTTTEQPTNSPATETTTQHSPCGNNYSESKNCRCMLTRDTYFTAPDLSLCGGVGLFLVNLRRPEVVNGHWTIETSQGPNVYKTGLVRRPEELNSTTLETFDQLVENNKTNILIEKTQEMLCQRKFRSVYSNLTLEIFDWNFRPRWVPLNLSNNEGIQLYFQFVARCGEFLLKLPQVLNVMVDQAYYDKFLYVEGQCTVRFTEIPELSVAWDYFNQTILENVCPVNF